MQTEAENCRVNGAMVRNVLDAVTADGSNVRHVALVTGTKNYLGPFEMYARNTPETPFREDQPRLPIENFYYVQEDIVFEAAARHGFGWSVHRPHTIVGYAVGNAMNIGVTLAVYASLCKATGRPFLFPGSPTQHGAIADVTDARLLAEARRLGFDDAGGAQRGLQRRQWRHLPAGSGCGASSPIISGWKWRLIPARRCRSNGR